MATLQSLIADATQVRGLWIADRLGLFPVEHPLREYLRDYPNLAGQMAKAKPCETAAAAMVKVRQSAVDDPQPWQLAVVDAIRDEVDPQKDELSAVQRSRFDRIIAGASHRNMRGGGMRRGAY